MPLEDVRINRYSPDGPLVARTDWNGRFSALQEGKIRRNEVSDDHIPLLLFASKHGFANYVRQIEAKPDETFHLGDIVLKPGGNISGRVTDQEGYPVSEAEVKIGNTDISGYSADHLKRFGGMSWGGVTCRTDENGFYHGQGVEAGWVRVWAKAEGTAHSYTDPVEIHAGRETPDIDLVLEPMPMDDSISGIVLSPEGEPVPWARLCFSYKSLFAGSATYEQSCEEDGRFLFTPRRDKAHDIEAIDRQERFTPGIVKAVEPGTHDLVIRLAPSTRLNLAVGTKGDRSLESLSVYLHNPDRRYVEKRAFFRAEDIREGGRVGMEVPSDFFQLEIRAPGFEIVKTGLFDPQSLPDPFEVELVAVAGVRGRVLAGARPVAGARISLHEQANQNGEYREHGFLCRSKQVRQVEALSDGQGRFDLALQTTGVFYLRAEMEGFAPAEIGPIGIDHTSGMDGLEITITEGGAIEGRVIMPPGRNPAGIIIGLSRADGFGITRRVGPEGSYRFESLTPGPWNLKQCDREIDADGRSTSFRGGFLSRAPKMPWVCVVEEGKTTRYDLDLSDSKGFLLKGRLLLDGNPPKAWNAEIQAVKGMLFRATAIKPPNSLDFEGGFLLQADEPGVHHVCFTGSPGQGPALSIVDQVTLEAGENPWNLDLALGRVTIKNIPEPQGPGAQILYKWQGSGRLASYTLITPEAGRDALTLTVPAGRGWIMQVGVSLSGMGEMKEEPLRQVDLPAGGAVTVEF
jgi:protocatechuate 3,4-dioxygenase beta subunit